MVEADDCVNASRNRIRWDLAPLGSDIAAWATSRVRDMLSQGFVKAFYIGLTAQLPKRWETTSLASQPCSTRSCVVLWVPKLAFQNAILQNLSNAGPKIDQKANKIFKKQLHACRRPPAAREFFLWILVA